MNPNLPIQNIMTSDLVIVKPNEHLHVVRTIFEKNNFHHLPVTGETGNLLGIISREDFYKVAYVLAIGNEKSHDDDHRFEILQAEDIMTRYPLQLDPDDTIGLAADIFLANKFHALPIVEDDKLVGMVTSHDLLAYSFNSPVERNVEIINYDEE